MVISFSPSVPYLTYSKCNLSSFHYTSQDKRNIRIQMHLEHQTVISEFYFRYLGIKYISLVPPAKLARRKIKNYKDLQSRMTEAKESKSSSKSNRHLRCNRQTTGTIPLALTKPPLVICKTQLTSRDDAFNNMRQHLPIPGPWEWFIRKIKMSNLV